MDKNGSTGLRRGSPSSRDRLLGAIFRYAPPRNSAADDFNEDDIFCTGDYSTADLGRRDQGPSALPLYSAPLHHLHSSPPFGQPDSFGILAVLPENDSHSVLNRTASISSSTSSSQSSSLSSSASSSSSRSISIPAVPKRPQERTLPIASSISASKHHLSAPVNIPVLPLAFTSKRVHEFDEIDVGDDDNLDGDGVMLPPHEIVARSLARSPMLACSVLEGAGRTLKGRDLRQVRNAIWRQTDGKSSSTGGDSFRGSLMPPSIA